MTSKYAEDIRGLKKEVVNASKEVAVLTTIVTLRQEESEKWREKADQKLDAIIANGKAYVTLDTLTKAMGAHVESCPGRQGNGRRIMDGARQNWPVLGAMVALATVLATILREVLGMLSDLLPPL